MRLLAAILLLLFSLPAHAQQAQGMSQALVVSSCGTQALTQGPVTGLTMNPQGQLCMTGISVGGFCGAATAYLARTSGGNEGGNAANIATLICGLVTDGIITGSLAGATSCGVYLDALYILAQQNAADAVLNLCGTSYTIAPQTSTFTSYQGYGPFTNPNGLDTFFNAATAPSPHFIQNSVTFGVWCYAVSASNAGGDFGENNTGGPNSTFLGANYSGTNSFYARINDGNAPSVTTPGTKGLFIGDRSSSTQTVPYWNGASQGAISSTSVAVDNVKFSIGFAYSYGATVNKISAAVIGGSLGSALELALYNRLRTYMSAVGVP